MATKPKTFTYNLTIFERMIFLNIYPQKGDHTSLALHAALTKKLITDEERNDIYQIKNEAICPVCDDSVTFTKEAPTKCTTAKCKGKPKGTGGVVWKTKDDDGNPIPQEREITIGEMANHAIGKALKELEEAEVLEGMHKTLFEKIVLGGVPAVPEDEDITMMAMPKEKK